MPLSLIHVGAYCDWCVIAAWFVLQGARDTLPDATARVLHRNRNIPLARYLNAEDKRELVDSRKTSPELSEMYYHYTC